MSPVLHAVVFVHIAAGLTAVVSGATAMLAPKRPGRHPRGGRVYLAALAAVVATATPIAVARPHTAYLLVLGATALTAAALGWRARRAHGRGWVPRHITGMAISYIALLTAFYVDNGPRLPLWNLLPPLVFWFLPAAVGLPLLFRALRRHTPHHRRAPAKEPIP